MYLDFVMYLVIQTCIKDMYLHTSVQLYIGTREAAEFTTVLVPIQPASYIISSPFF